MASTNFRSFMTAPKAAIMSFKGTSINSAGSIGQMVELSEKARRNGLLALEEDVAKIDDAFTRKGLQLVVDGTDSDLVHAILESEIDGLAARHAQVAGPVHHRRRLRADGRHHRHGDGPDPRAPEPGRAGRAGPARSRARSSPPSTACRARTCMLLPIGNKLKEMSAVELNHRTMVLDAILSIQAGDNPRVLAEKLESFVAPADRGSQKSETGRPPRRS